MAAFITTRLDARNLVLLAIAAVAAVAVLAAEGYLRDVDLMFAIFSAVVLGGAAVTSLRFVSTRRWLALFFTAGVFGLATQFVGVRAGAWSYPNAPHSYWFVFFCFGFGSLFIYGLATLISYRLPRHAARPLGPILIAIPVAAVAIGAHSYAAFNIFTAYYLWLFIFGFFYSLLARWQTIAAVLLAGCAFGALAETLGAHSHLWRFYGADASGTGLPPAWLVAGSWPLESLLHVGLSALIARAHFDLPRLRAREPRTFALAANHSMNTVHQSQAVIVRRGGDDKFKLLDDAIDAGKFFDRLEAAFVAGKKDREAFAIVVKPNFMFMYSKADHSTYTDPELVEHLIDRIFARGFRNIAVVEAQSCYGNEFSNREVGAVARWVGYSEKNYRVVDLTAEKVPHRFAPPLGEHSVGPTWRDADFRVSFAKNKTHTWAVYTLTIKNIYGALAEQNKLYEYHDKREIYAPTIDMLLAFPVHFGFVDAWTSSDGPFGIFANTQPKATKTILAGESLLAVDWVGATLMGLDPMKSRYMQLAVQAFGTPSPQIDGDMTPYAPWKNVPDWILTEVDAMEELYGFTNVLFAIMDRMDGVFPRRKHGPLWHVARALAEPVRRRIFDEPLDADGKPDARLD
jgi:uncharacterized protein (DUF362 family)